MEQTSPLRKTARRLAVSVSLFGLVACASGGKPDAAPTIRAPVSAGQAATLRSAGYDAPLVDLSNDATAQDRSAAPLIVPAAYVTPDSLGFVAADTAVTQNPYFVDTPEPAGPATVPPPAPSAYAPGRVTSARAALPDLDAIVITDDRKPTQFADNANAAQTYQGETRSVLSDRVPAPKPAVSTQADTQRQPTSSGRFEKVATPTTEPVSTGRSALHLASYRQVSKAEDGWIVLQQEYPAILASLQPTVTQIQIPGQGTFVRLLAGPLSDEEAKSACATLESRGTYCAVMDWPTQNR